MCGCRGDKAVEYSRKLEYLKREEELIKEEELEAEALLQPSAQTLQVPLHPFGSSALAGCCARLPVSLCVCVHASQACFHLLGKGCSPQATYTSVVTSPHTYDVLLSNACATMAFCLFSFFMQRCSRVRVRLRWQLPQQLQLWYVRRPPVQ